MTKATFDSGKTPGSQEISHNYKTVVDVNLTEIRMRPSLMKLLYLTTYTLIKIMKLILMMRETQLMVIML